MEEDAQIKKGNIRDPDGRIIMNSQEQAIILTIGIPASGKSTWAVSWVGEDPLHRVRINKDAIRALCNNFIWSKEHEQMITAMQRSMVRQALISGHSVVLDNTNIEARYFNDACNLVRELNIDCVVSEKPFFIQLDEAIARDAKREGSAKVGEAVVRKFWKASGGESFKGYQAKTETIAKRSKTMQVVQDRKLPRAVVFDNDGTISLIHSGRSPYDASTADQDHPQEHVIECMRNYYKLGYKILFVSGREDKDRAPTERFYKQHFPEVEYELYMRPTGNQEKDWLIKERIFNEHIKPRYFVAGWFDDRLQVAKWVYESGLPLFRVGDPEAVF
jgi:predicted kinase